MMKKIDFLKRLIVLLFSYLSLILQVVSFSYIWYEEYAGMIQVYFYEKGHWLVIGIYAILLFFFYQMYGALKIGYLRSGEVLFSQIFATIIMTLISYGQISLLIGWFAEIKPIAIVFVINIVIILICTYMADKLYRAFYPPRRLLLIHGDREIDSILTKFRSRTDKYDIVKYIHYDADNKDDIFDRMQGDYDGVVIWDIPNVARNTLVKLAYGKGIRVYLMPKITDVLVAGSEQIHLFDTPILLMREYALTIGQRIVKRMIDLICSSLLLLITLPIMLITAVTVKLYDGGPILYKQIRCTRGMKEFNIYKFRSMRVDAEKDGVARLATVADDRITPIGRFIRKVRIDELPQLLNILKGDMSFIGPRPERPEIISQYLEEIPEFRYRTKVKAGLAGYAQVYGKYNTTPYDKLKLDLFYIENYTTWLDFKLMLLTLKILLNPESTEGVSK